MNSTLQTNGTRSRNYSNFDNDLNCLTILKNVAPRIQFQYNDKFNQCIGRSPCLRLEKKITRNSTIEDFRQTTFIPKEGAIVDVPTDATSILVFGKIGRFVNKESAINKLCPSEFDYSYNPTHGIKISNFYLNMPFIQLLPIVYQSLDGNK